MSFRQKKTRETLPFSQIRSLFWAGPLQVPRQHTDTTRRTPNINDVSPETILDSLCSKRFIPVIDDHSFLPHAGYVFDTETINQSSQTCKFIPEQYREWLSFSARLSDPPEMYRHPLWAKLASDLALSTETLQSDELIDHLIENACDCVCAD